MKVRAATTIAWVLVGALALASLSAGAKDVPKAVRDAMETIGIDSRALVEPSPLAGFYSIRTRSGNVYFMSADGVHLIDGKVINVPKRDNYTARMKREFAKASLDGLEGLVSYKPKRERHRVVVFTDVNCTYCRKFHAQMPFLLEKGVRVDYVIVAMLGGKEGQDMAVSVWCAPDKNRAVDIAKGGGQIEPASCPHPVKENTRLAARLGVRGTPSIFLPDGSMLGGYYPPNALFDALEQVAAGG